MLNSINSVARGVYRGKLKDGPTCRLRQEAGSWRTKRGALLKQKLHTKNKPRELVPKTSKKAKYQNKLSGKKSKSKKHIPQGNKEDRGRNSEKTSDTTETSGRSNDPREHCEGHVL